MNLELWFPQPIWYADNNADFSEAIYFCKEMQNSNNGVIKSNHGGWQSNPLNLLAYEQLKSVTDIIKSKLQFIESQLDKTKFKSIELLDAWININNKHSYNVKHSHPGATFSGCIYLQVPKDSGKIIFFRPDHKELFPVPSDIYNPILFNDTTYAAIAGRILIFPAWLEHEVGMSYADEDRISIAFNILCK